MSIDQIPHVADGEERLIRVAFKMQTAWAKSLSDYWKFEAWLRRVGQDRGVLLGALDLSLKSLDAGVEIPLWPLDGSENGEALHAGDMVVPVATRVGSPAVPTAPRLLVDVQPVTS